MKKVEKFDLIFIPVIFLLLLPPAYHQISHGSFLQVDYYYFVSAALLTILMALPTVIKINIFTLIMLLGVIELAFIGLSTFDINPGGPGNTADTIVALPSGKALINKDIRRTDPVIGYKPSPDICYKIIRKKQNNIVVYNVDYCVDNHGRRIVPLVDQHERKQFLITFGGSNTFGHGVNDDQTWPYYLASMAENYQPYNYAYGGYGPQHMLAKLQTNTMREQVTENDGIALYYFIDDHIKRVMNTLKTRWTHRSPYYKLDDDGSLKNEGLFNKARPILYSFYHDILLKSKAIEMLPIDFPPQISDADIVTTCAIIAASRDEYKKQFNNKNFYVIFSPIGAKNKFRKSLITCLERNSISVLDYSEVNWPNSYRIWGDGHPTSEAYKDIAGRIISDLAVH